VHVVVTFAVKHLAITLTKNRLRRVEIVFIEVREVVDVAAVDARRWRCYKTHVHLVYTSVTNNKHTRNKLAMQFNSTTLQFADDSDKLIRSTGNCRSNVDNLYLPYTANIIIIRRKITTKSELQCWQLMC